jgi:hypothetical protein
MKHLLAVLMTMATPHVISQTVEPAAQLFLLFNHTRDFSLSAKGDEMYFTIQSPNQNLSRIAVAKKQGAEWGNPELASFSGKYNDLEPFLSPDGRRLYFASNRPQVGQADSVKDFDIWYVERNSPTGGWSVPVNVGGPVNTKNDEFYPIVTRNNNLYFTCDCPGGLGKDDIYLSRWNGKSYETPVLLDTTINSPGYEFNAWVSADEQTMIYTRYGTRDGKGSGDLYISRKNGAGQWNKPKNLGDVINTRYMEYCPFYDPSTSTLYFTGKRDMLESQKFKNIDHYIETIGQYQNGESRNYKVKFLISDY